jgi:hypothetical protein
LRTLPLSFFLSLFLSLSPSSSVPPNLYWELLQCNSESSQWDFCPCFRLWNSKWVWNMTSGNGNSGVSRIATVQIQDIIYPQTRSEFSTWSLKLSQFITSPHVLPS